MKIALYISSQSEKIKDVIFIIHKPIPPLHFLHSGNIFRYTENACISF